MNKRIRRALSLVLMFSLAISLGATGLPSHTAHAAGLSITKAGGWNETAYVEWAPESNAVGYNVYVKPANASDSSYRQLDNELIRKYPAYWRADAVGLTAGSYVMKVEARRADGSLTAVVSGPLSVASHDRSGFAFSSNSPFGSGSGAYQDNGALKNGAQVLYITSQNARTVTLDVITNSSGRTQTGVGLGDILNLRQKGYDTTPLAIRFIGKITANDLSGQLNSNGYLQVKGKNNYAEMNITLEGIGNDAYAYGWGFLLRAVGNVEVRNLGLMLFPDDGISMDTGNVNVWVHHNDIFYGSAGSDADQAKGDGSTDLKKGSTYITISYNHYWESGKVALVGLSETAEFFVTFHHNWFDHSDSRHPRIRVASVHIYNNFYDGISKYGVGVTTGASAFVEANYFRHAKYPMMSSLQGTDALGDGTFSGEDGGVIKAYNNIIVDADSLIYANSNSGTTSAHATSFDAYLASSRNESVPSSYKALKGGTAYNNFDTRLDLGVSSSNIDSVNAVQQIVTAEAGRLDGGDFDWQFNNAVDDTSYAMNTALMNKIRSYTTQLVSVGGNSSTSPEPEPEPEPNPGTGPITGELAHNFTTAGTSSDFFNIQGNLSTSKGTVVYKGLTLTQCLKIETATRIEFTTTEASTLTLVFNQESGKKIKIDGTNYTLTDGVVSVPLAPGAHTITKADSINLYYIELQ
ncbi:pectate lyase family protein [Paenibacillus senegalimassiliensis]|uniref:pectate lyase family protein n=1 Tax=Paenibacillus senegalimassiliensis TaxID=1737426 RepID=UPI00073F4662|nr:pectate lyase [Paenibacillus senegalimassiliensis]